MKNRKIKIRILSITIAAIFFTVPASVFAEKNQTNSVIESIHFSQNFSEPNVLKIENYIEVTVEEANSDTFLQGTPNLPVFRKTYEFFWDTNIIDVSFVHSDVETKDLSGSLKTTPVFKSTMNGEINIQQNVINTIMENNDTYFPNSWYSVEKSAGLNKDGEHVFFLTLNIYPTRYNKDENELEYITESTFEITYEESSTEFCDPDIYDLVIISPEEFKENLTSLVNHKNSYGLKTNITCLDEIYGSYSGIDEAEKIKYFIKDAIENWGTKYVLLVGEIRMFPIRKTDAYPWQSHGDGLLSDLYYADIYNSEYEFSSWDTNEDGVFGQIIYNWSWNNINIEIVDDVDLYPDVHVGRLACRSIDEVDLCVKKIISYETDTYGKDWFNKIILAGGDTFPPGGGSSFNVFEGEITNSKVAEEMSDFEQIKLWSSKRKLNAFTFNRAINDGAGFLTYAGHGFEHGWGTYKANSLRAKMSLTNPLYYTPFLQFLNNEGKLPIVFLDACLTAKLDFWIGDLTSYYKPLKRIVKLIGIEPNKNNHLPCFAWSFIIQEGGAIGTIGSTRPAYSSVDREGIHSGAGYLDWMFFKNYYEGVRLGDMLTNAQISYIQNRFMDYFTIEEYLLLGDPSLMVGGYPPK